MPVVPLWLTAPLAGALMVLIAAHILALRAAGERVDPARRRIRTVNGFVGMATLPLTVYAFSVVTPQQPRQFMLTWMLVMGLLVLTILLASVDMFNTARLNREKAREMREQLRELSGRLRALQGEPSGHSPRLRLHRDDDADGPDEEERA